MIIPRMLTICYLICLNFLMAELIISFIFSSSDVKQHQNISCYSCSLVWVHQPLTISSASGIYSQGISAARLHSSREHSSFLMPLTFIRSPYLYFTTPNVICVYLFQQPLIYCQNQKYESTPSTTFSELQTWRLILLGAKRKATFIDTYEYPFSK